MSGIFSSGERQREKGETMARRNSNFIIGLFVTAGVVLGVVAIVWLGASQYFEEGAFYVTYFDESVQGLQVDSRVKYRGVDIGKVQSIGVAPDRKLVEVVMKIDLGGEAGKNVVTQLRSAGITGIVFIELDRKNENDTILLPPPGMMTRYPVIASQLSQTTQMLTSVDRIMGKIEQVDLKGISEQLKETSKAGETFLTGKQMTGILAKLDSTVGSLDNTSRVVETFLTGKQMTGIMANLDSTVGSLEQGMRRIDRILMEGRVEGVLDATRHVLDETRQGVQEARQGLQEARKTIADTRELLAAVQGEMKNLKVSETADRASRLIEGIDRRTGGMKTDFERTTEDIRQAVDSLKLLLDRLQANPSDLIFSRSPIDEGPQRGEVER
jgi:phospholipid/cholesterol/gamma-HCH transport system substrate-binding protein